MNLVVGEIAPSPRNTLNFLSNREHAVHEWTWQHAASRGNKGNHTPGGFTAEHMRGAVACIRPLVHTSERYIFFKDIPITTERTQSALALHAVCTQ